VPSVAKKSFLINGVIAWLCRQLIQVMAETSCIAARDVDWSLL
jgi:hypothetical protein